MDREVPKRYVAADEFLRDSWRLAAKVRAQPWRPDTLVALWRGGAGAGMAVHEFLAATGWRLRHLPLKCSSYTGIAENSSPVSFSLEDSFFALFRQGERVLVVDDVYDTGKTAAAVRKRFASAGTDMRLATVYLKKGADPSGGEPDFFARDLGDEWIVFPHEIEGLSCEEIRTKDPLLSDLMNEISSPSCR